MNLFCQFTLTEWSFGKAPDLYLFKFYQKYIPASNKIGTCQINGPSR